jgi:hypothetical protein
MGIEPTGKGLPSNADLLRPVVRPMRSPDLWRLYLSRKNDSCGCTGPRSHRAVSGSHRRYPGVNLNQKVEIHNVTALGSHKPGRIEFQFDRGHGRTQWIGAATRMQVHVISLRFQAFNVIDGHQEFLAELAHQETLWSLQ